MKKSLIILTVLSMIGLTCAQLSYAQMINYKRRNQNKGVISQSSYQAKSNTIASSKTQSSTETDPAVTNRVERLYDLNRDGLLQKAEVKDFYKDVVSSVKNKGKFEVSSELLRGFDADKDGQITMYEIKEISNQIN